MSHKFLFMNNRIKAWLKSRSERTQAIVKNVGLSLLMKVACILASLLIVPLTIGYVNPTQYGIWLTLSSVIGWVTFFDLGLGNGFRNKFAEAKARGNTLLARQLLSTTYLTIGAIVVTVYVVTLVVNHFLDWPAILKVSTEFREELSRVFIIVILFTCVNMVANVFGTLLQADQKPGYSSVITAIGQYVSLIAIFLLGKFTSGSLTNLAVFYSGIPCLVMLVSSLLAFHFTSYKQYAPSFKYYDRKLIGQIMGLGYQFFIIYLCLIAIFQVISLVITREIGPLGVTQYNIANRYFNIIFMLISIIVTPFWSAFTDAYTKKDFSWMQSMIRKLQQCWCAFVVVGLFMLLFSRVFYKLWVGDSVSIPFALSSVMLLLVLAQSFGNIFMCLINGIGTVRIQLVTYVIFALVAWPLLTYAARYFGLTGLVLIPTLVYSVQGILARIQVGKIVNGKAKGLWLK